MSSVRCDVERCPNRLGGMCTAESIQVSQTGKCQTMGYVDFKEGECMSCAKYRLYQTAPNYYKPICEDGNVMTLFGPNECWQKK